MPPLALLLLGLGSAAGLTIYGAVEPAAPGDIVTLAGDGLSNASLSVCEAASPTSCLDVSPLGPTAYAVKFALPLNVSTPAILNVIVTLAGGDLASVTLGLPRVDWFSAPGAAAPRTVSPGGLLMLFGRNLAFDPAGRCSPWTTQAAGPTSGAANVVATPAGRPPTDPAAVRLPAWSGDAVSLPVRSCFRLDSAVPGDLPPGLWDVYVTANGLAGLNASAAPPAIAGLRVAPPPAWPPGTWTLGSSPGCADLASCLAVAGAAGGGTVTVPAGTWTMPGGALLSFPNASVAVVGAGRDASVVEWQQGTYMGPKCAGGVVTSAFPGVRWAISDVSLVVRAACQPGAQPPNGMPIVAIPSGSVGVSLARLRIVNDLSLYPGIQLGNAIAASNASLFSVVDVDVQHSGSCDAQWPNNAALYISGNSTDAHLRGLRVVTTCPGYSVTSSSRVAMTDSAWVSVGDVSEGQGFNTLGAPSVLEHIYYGNTSTAGNPAAPERWESMTYDGPGGQFNGSVASAAMPHPDGTATYILDGTVSCRPWNGACLPAGLTVALLRGPGTGQYRRLVSATPGNGSVGGTVTVDALFDPPPEVGVSLLSIVGYSGRAIFEGNALANGTVFQTYGSSLNAIMAGNTFDGLFDTADENTTAVAAGVRLFGHRYQGGWEPNWYTLFAENTVSCATELVAYSDNIDGAVFSLGHVFRRNTVAGGVDLSLNFAWDTVIDHNTFASAFCWFPNASLPAGGVSYNASSPGTVVA